MSDVTQLLESAAAGDPRAAADLLPLVYDELRKLAAARLASEKPGQTLQATALVHEAYMRLVGSDDGAAWNSRGHFFAAAAEAIRRILVENARRKSRVKHGGMYQKMDLDDVTATSATSPEELLAIDDALTALASEDAHAAEIIKLRFFAGFSIEEAGEMLGLSRTIAYDHWSYGRAWLRCRLSEC